MVRITLTSGAYLIPHTENEEKKSGCGITHNIVQVHTFELWIWGSNPLSIQLIFTNANYILYFTGRPLPPSSSNKPRPILPLRTWYLVLTEKKRKHTSMGTIACTHGIYGAWSPRQVPTRALHSETGGVCTYYAYVQFGTGTGAGVENVCPLQKNAKVILKNMWLCVCSSFCNTCYVSQNLRFSFFFSSSFTYTSHPELFTPPWVYYVVPESLHQKVDSGPPQVFRIPILLSKHLLASRVLALACITYHDTDTTPHDRPQPIGPNFPYYCIHNPPQISQKLQILISFYHYRG